MQIKVFKAGTMREAMNAMKAELGDEAVILHSKKYKEGGLLGIGSREVVEITAAVEETSMPKKSETQRATAPSSFVNRYKTDGTAEGISAAEQSNQIDSLVEKVSAHKSSLNEEIKQQNTFEDALHAAQSDTVDDTPPPIDEPPTPADEPAPVEENPAPADESTPVEENPASADESAPVDENSTPADESAPVEENSTPADEPAPADENSAPAEESSTDEQPIPPPPQANATFTQEQMAQTQAMIMAQFNQMQMMQQAAIAQAQAAEHLRIQQEQSQSSPNEDKIKRLEDEIAQMKALLAEVLGRDPKRGALSLHEAMKLQEVDEDILSEMATQSNPGDTLADVHTPAAKSTLIKYLNDHMTFSEGIKLNRHGVRIVALLGTTGVGKTTTLAKIAAKFVLEQRTNVALITADTYRISAVEQLKTYSDILELPLEIVYNPQELHSAIERHRDKELILIDTAGRSQHNEYQMRELEEFLRINPRIEKHLVISATTKLTDARQIMNKFAQVNPDRIIFTKTDETGSLGMIVNLLRDSRYALSYITTGQSVPDDIERATVDVLTNFLLKKVDEL